MARKIFLKEGGLNNSDIVPSGYKAIGIDSNSQLVISSDGELSSVSGSTERVDVLSVGVVAGDYCGQMLNSKGVGIWDIYGRYLLWEAIDSNGVNLVTDLDFSNLTYNDLLNIMDVFTINDNKSISIKAYYYKNQGREKFRIVGRNYTWWSLVGLKNHDRMKGGRPIESYENRSTNGQILINYLNSEYGIGTASGEGLIFTSNKSRYVNKRTSPVNSTTNQFDSNKSTYGRWGITQDTNEYLKIGWDSATQSLISMQAILENDSRQIIHMDRDGNIAQSQYKINGPVTTPPFNGSAILLNEMRINTTDYQNPDNLLGYLVRPMGQDTFLLSHNSQISNQDMVFLISEPNRGTSIVQQINVNSLIDNQGFGSDIGTDELKTQKNRFGNIRIEDIGKGRGLLKSLPKRITHQNNDRGFDRGFSTKWRVAWGKNGNYTVSDDYIYIRGNGYLTIGYVNREI